MTRQQAKANLFSQEELNNLIIESIQDIKGKNIVKLDLRSLDDAPTDYFIICEGDSTTQVNAIANNIKKRIKEEADFNPSYMEGMSSAQWVLVDYFNTIIHVFHPETRTFYDLESLWNDATFVEYDNL